MTRPLKIDFVSDVACPWCAIGLAALERAMADIGNDLQVELRFQPFELNPDMGPQGESIAEHLGKKYGLSGEQLAQNGEALRQRGEALGFRFDLQKRDRIYNTFDAHRLLHWAGVESPMHQLPLKRALLVANFSEGRDVSDHAVLAELATGVGLDDARAREVLASGLFADEVRAAERFFREAGIRSVPAVIIERRLLVSGGQPPEVFVQALRQAARADN